MMDTVTVVVYLYTDWSVHRNDERRYKRNRYKRYISENMLQESIQNTASVRSVILEQRAAELQPKRRQIMSTLATTLKKQVKTASVGRARDSDGPQEVPQMTADINSHMDPYVPVTPIEVVPGLS